MLKECPLQLRRSCVPGDAVKKMETFSRPFTIFLDDDTVISSEICPFRPDLLRRMERISWIRFGIFVSYARGSIGDRSCRSGDITDAFAAWPLPDRPCLDRPWPHLTRTRHGADRGPPGGAAQVGRGPVPEPARSTLRLQDPGSTGGPAQAVCISSFDKAPTMRRIWIGFSNRSTPPKAAGITDWS